MDGMNTTTFGAPVHGGPQPIEIVFSFDTTGSMSSYLEEVKKEVEATIKRLFTDIPQLKIAVIAHGDYCDARWSYVTKHIDFSNDVDKLCEFVTEAGPTGGGDSPECYELVLYKVRTELSWQPGTQRALVMIGDDLPHGPSYPENTLKLSWKNEVKALHDIMNVHIYSVQAGCNDGAKTNFWEPMAKRTNGKYLTLNQLSTIVNMVMAICYREHGAEFLSAFEMEVRNREGKNMAAELDRMFDALRDDDDDNDTTITTPSPLLRKTSSKIKTKKPVAKSLKLTGAAKAVAKTKSKVATPKTTGAACLHAKVKATALAPKVRKAVKLNKMTPKSTSANVKMGRQHREKVPETRFALRNLKWSSWKVILAPKIPAGQKTDSWEEALQGIPGVRHLNMFGGKTEVPAVYEVAVQPRAACRKYVLGCRSSKGFSGHNWDAYFCRDNMFEKQILHAVEMGCTVLVRRVIVNKALKCEGKSYKNALELCSFLRRHYDYAWHLTRKGKWWYTRSVTWRKMAISL